jgi:hypothetical protein
MAALAFATALVCSGFGLSKQCLELDEDPLDRMRSGEYLGRKTRRAPRLGWPVAPPFLCGSRDCRGLRRRPVEGRAEELFNIGAEAFAVTGAVEQAGRVDAVVSQGGEKRRGLPAAMRNLVDEALPFRRPAVRDHVSLANKASAFLLAPAQPTGSVVRRLSAQCRVGHPT